MRKVDKTVRTSGDVEWSKTRHNSIDGVRKHADLTQAAAEHPHWLATTYEDASMAANLLERAKHVRLIGQFGLYVRR